MVRHQAEGINDVWSWNFIFDRTAGDRPLKWLVIIDEFTRENLCLEVEHSMTSEDIINLLVELFKARGLPRHIRSDNGPEFIANALRNWFGKLGIETLYIEPGSPWQNGYAESFNNRLRDEFLALEVFENLTAAKTLTRMYRANYNEHRPHSSLDYLPRGIRPAVFRLSRLRSFNGTLPEKR
ncbi:MAG: transposase family protein [Planctomycetaceae bacterium]|nr:transposase family protein [Planctomycetaceae bacterium]